MTVRFCLITQVYYVLIDSNILGSSNEEADHTEATQGADGSAVEAPKTDVDDHPSTPSSNRRLVLPSTPRRSPSKKTSAINWGESCAVRAHPGAEASPIYSWR